MRLIQTLGEWDGQAALCVSIQKDANAAHWAMIALDDRKNGAGYTDQDRKHLEELAQKIARALEEDALEDRD